jgi:tetratricopeptide (TPR) repeat protein
MKSSFLPLLFLVCALPAVAQRGLLSNPSPAGTSAQWQADIDFLSDQLQRKHIHVFHKISKPDFDQEVSELRRQVPNLTREQVIAGIMKIVASVGDGHTSVPIPALREQGFHILPVRFYAYADGIYVQGVDRKYEKVLGAKIISLGNMSARDAFLRVSETVARDNEMTLKDRVPYYLAIPELLFGLGITDNPQKASMVVEKRGERFTMDLDAVVMPDLGYAVPILAAFSSDWLDDRAQDSSAAPLWLLNTTRNYWMQFIPQSNTLYVQYNRCREDPNEPMAAFVKRLAQEIENQPVEKLVLDLRLNSGGDGTLNKPLVLALIKADKINQKGKLFAIVGRRTFSAGQLLANELEYYTNVTFVGEPTGAPPHFFGDEDTLVLPNSHLVVAYALAWWQNNIARDNRQWISPAVAADLTEPEFAQNRDPALEAIASWVPVRAQLGRDLESASISDFPAIVDRHKNDPRNRYLDFEAIVNEAGYAFLRRGATEKAIALFQLNTNNYPDSANAFDSLGEAYLAAGKKELAIENYNKALAIRPDFRSSQEALKKLQSQ